MTRSRRRETVKTSKLKTLLCTYVDKPEGCQYGENCAFAHSIEELRPEVLPATTTAAAPETSTDATAAAPVSPKGEVVGDGMEPHGSTATADSNAHVPFSSINNVSYRVNALEFSPPPPPPLPPHPLSFSTGLTKSEPTPFSMAPPFLPSTNSYYVPTRVPRKSRSLQTPPPPGAATRNVLKMSWNASSRPLYNEDDFRHRSVGSIFHPDVSPHCFGPPAGFNPSPPYVFMPHPHTGGPVMMRAVGEPRSGTTPEGMEHMHVYPLSVPADSMDPWGNPNPNQMMYSMCTPTPLTPPSIPMSNTAAVTSSTFTTHVSEGTPQTTGDLPVRMGSDSFAFEGWPSLIADTQQNSSESSVIEPTASPPERTFVEPNAFSTSPAIDPAMFEFSDPPSPRQAVPPPPPTLQPPRCFIPSRPARNFPCRLLLGSVLSKPKPRMVVMNQKQSSCAAALPSPVEAADVDGFL